MTRPVSFAAFFSLFLSPFALAQQFDERFTDWPERTTIGGTIIIGQSAADPSELQQLLPAPTEALRVALIKDGSLIADGIESVYGDCDLRTPDTDADPKEWLWQQLRQADVVLWFSDKTEDYGAWGSLRKEITRFVERGGVFALIGPHCSIAGSKYQSVEQSRVWKQGLSMIPDSVIVAVSSSETSNSSLEAYLRSVPGHFGLRLQDKGLLLLRGRKFMVTQTGSAEFCLPSCKWLPERLQVLKARTSPRQDPNEYLVDLTEWRRDAIERTLERFPPEQPKAPHVNNGTLVIVGGGGMPAGLMEDFIDMAGGKEEARLVYVPCAEQAELSPQQGTVRMWERMGVRHASFIHTKDRFRANHDEELLEPLRNATGIWFGGGRQWNFSDSWYGTTAHKLMKDVLKRGGVIGGSSAGASIQGRYLARATPIQNFRIMAPGYERGGLGFLSGVAIDQHFSQRKRQGDMEQLVSRYPQLLGIVLDEATAIIVQKSVADVVGKGKVFFYDNRKQPADGPSAPTTLAAGGSYDLSRRVTIRTAPPENAETSSNSQ